VKIKSSLELSASLPELTGQAGSLYQYKDEGLRQEKRILIKVEILPLSLYSTENSM